jgi:hypothetical protein
MALSRLHSEIRSVALGRDFDDSLSSGHDRWAGSDQATIQPGFDSERGRAVSIGYWRARLAAPRAGELAEGGPRWLICATSGVCCVP